MNVRSWERLSSECRKIIIKVPVIITANQRKENFTRSKWDLKLKNTIKLPEARENAGDYEANGEFYIWLVERVARIFWFNCKQRLPRILSLPGLEKVAQVRRGPLKIWYFE